MADVRSLFDDDSEVESVEVLLMKSSPTQFGRGSDWLFRVGVGSVSLCWFRIPEDVAVCPYTCLVPGNLQIPYPRGLCLMPCPGGVRDLSRECWYLAPGLLKSCPGVHKR